jgi:hypothetical protein
MTVWAMTMTISDTDDSKDQTIANLAESLDTDTNRAIKAAMLQKTLDLVLSSSQWLTAAQLSELAASSENASERAQLWEREGTLFAVRNSQDEDVYPLYALDASTHYTPYPVMKSILAVLAPHLKGLAIAAWFAAANVYLNGSRPMDLLAEAPDRVIAAAKASMIPPDHG